jgi:hypothetical protein
MTTYKELFGKYVQNYASDPTSTDAVGQIWYNTTTGTFRTALGNYGVWSSAAAFNTSRSAASLAGTQTAAVLFGGYVQPTPPQVVAQTTTEKWNGTVWTSNPTGLNTARYGAFTFGTQTAALAAGGNLADPTSYSTTAVESFNGSTWTNGTGINTPRYNGGSSQAGPQTAGLIFGGFRINPGFTQMSSSESWNGSSWTNTPSLNTGPAFSGGTGIGTQSAAMYAGREPVVTTVEVYNGTSWTSGTALPIGRNSGGGAGTQTAALLFTGYLAPASSLTNSTIYYNGTAWASVANVGTARAANNGGAGTNSNALLVGSPGSPSNLTEAWNTGDVVPVAGSWSSGGNLNTARQGLALAGTQTAAVAFGSSPAAGTTELYNGTSWTSNPTGLNTGRGFLGGAGIQTAALAFGGGPVSTATELWNGTSWTNNPTGLNTGRQELAGCGLQTAALAVNGISSPGGTRSAASESFNGTSWTNTPSLNTANYGRTLFGTNTAAICAGGADAPITAVESWNGTSWTTNPASLNTGRTLYTQSSGTQTAGLTFGGAVAPYNTASTATELWNGTSWTTMNNLATGRYWSTGCGTQTAALMAGGSTGSATAATEEWTGPSTTLNYKTLTTS